MNMILIHFDELNFQISHTYLNNYHIVQLELLINNTKVHIIYSNFIDSIDL